MPDVVRNNAERLVVCDNPLRLWFRKLTSTPCPRIAARLTLVPHPSADVLMDPPAALREDDRRHALWMRPPGSIHLRRRWSSQGQRTFSNRHRIGAVTDAEGRSGLLVALQLAGGDRSLVAPAMSGVSPQDHRPVVGAFRTFASKNSKIDGNDGATMLV